MDDKGMKKNVYDTMYLASCALHSVVPQGLEQMDLEKVYKLCRFHSIRATIYVALEMILKSNENTSLQISVETLSEWSRVKSMILRKDLAFDFEREKLLSFMEEKGIWYLPMKGIYLRKLYPQMGMRYLADNDILFDENYRKDVRGYMESNGYKTEAYGKGAHDIYTKPPFYNFEMHVGLYRGTGGREALIKLSDYYEDIFKKLLPDANKKYAYNMSDEDFYILLVTHAYKHHVCGGTGLRTFIDTFVFLKAKGNLLDWDYITTELEKISLCDYEKEIREISVALLSEKCLNFNLSGSELSEKQTELVLLYARSGTYGTLQQHMEGNLSKYSDKTGKISKMAKVKYCFRRVFPDMRYYKEYAPFVYKHKILIPFFLVGRGFKAVFISGNAAKELKKVNKTKIEKKDS